MDLRRLSPREEKRSLPIYMDISEPLLGNDSEVFFDFFRIVRRPRVRVSTVAWFAVQQALASSQGILLTGPWASGMLMAWEGWHERWPRGVRTSGSMRSGDAEERAAFSGQLSAVGNPQEAPLPARAGRVRLSSRPKAVER